MKNKWTRLLLVGVLLTFLVAVGAIQAFAANYSVGHCDPTGTTSTYYAYSSADCNRKINVSFKDTSGNLLKKVVINTKRGVEATFSIHLGGYDIIGFSSNQGIWETCKLMGSSGTGTCTSAYLYVTYYFRTALSQDELNITVTMRKWDAITLEVRHYVENDPTLNNFHRDNYTLHSTTNTQSLNYYDSFSVSKKTITGYTLTDGYQSTVSGKMCYTSLVGASKNMPSSPRCYSYSLSGGTNDIDSSGVSSYSESSDGSLASCSNRKIWVEFFYDRNEYTISFNANGGTGAPDALVKYYGYAQTIPDTVPTRSGYTFKGWGISSTSTTASYQPGGSYTANTSRTLYAIWESNTSTTYTIRYYANGGIGAPASQTKYHGVSLALSSTQPTRTGYTFNGWATSSTATTATYSSGATYTANASLNLYAVWTQNPATYTVTYDANGGYGAPASQTKTERETLILSSTVPIRSGYSFVGWGVASNATLAVYSPGSAYTVNTSQTLYAIWEQSTIMTYLVTYDANGGTGAPTSQTKFQDITLTLTSTKPTRSGYIFLGWSTDKMASIPLYYAGGSYPFNFSVLLYAVWEYDPPETYTVNYDANGGAGAPVSQVKTEDVALILSTAVPARSGYTFCGWATDSEATVVVYAAGDTYTQNASLTLYAVWQQNPIVTYTVSYNANGGYGAPTSQTKAEGETLILASTTPTRSGYTFLGWATTSSATGAAYSAGDSYSVDASITLYAVWEPNPVLVYTVSYDANGGTGAPADQTKIQDVSLALSSATPTRSGYTFLGWSTSSSAASPTYYAGGSYTANASATLYAVWSYNVPATYTISFDANGGSGAPGSVTKTDGVTLYLPGTTPTRFNYIFLGWSTSSSATTTIYSAGGSFTRDANTILYAVWSYSPVTYSVNYSANGGSGAPASQTKTYGVALALSSVTPTRSGYDFLGWGTSSAATSATYAPGDSYTTNASVTFYAVWRESNYDFSVTDLTVSNSTPYKYDQISITVKTDSWDQVNAYSGIPVQLYYDGRLVSTQYVDFSVYGVANITFTLNVGSSVGNKVIEARINWTDYVNETATENNSASVSINVQDFDYEVTVNPVTVAGNYCEGMEVVSSFFVANNSDYDITPEMHNTVRFTAYYYNGSQRVVISTQNWDDVVIPAAGTNLVYFKWTVPASLNGKTVYLDCTVNADRHMNEANYDNNTSSSTVVISTTTDSQTPNTRFESTAPSSYLNATVPVVSTSNATWTMWEYENGSFVLKRYGIQISSVSPVVTPSSDCTTAVYENGKWTMRSGYGITISYAPTISTVSGYNRPDSNAYTSVQYVVATFPEFRYFDTNGNCRTLEYVNGSYQFMENTDADGNARIHFIPVYVNDGNYTVSVTATHVWTPAGMIEATRSANVIIIDGTIYDDWYPG